MALTAKALLLRIAAMKAEAIKSFASNPYVTIHDYSHSSLPDKNNPFSVWIDVNYPVYVLENNTPVLRPEGVKDICIKFCTGYPEERPLVIMPVSIASIHTWNNKVACTHAKYIPELHNLAMEISNIMKLCANCPEGLNYGSPTPDHRWLTEWTKKSLEAHILPTVSYAELFKVKRVRKTIIWP